MPVAAALCGTTETQVVEKPRNHPGVFLYFCPGYTEVLTHAYPNKVCAGFIWVEQLVLKLKSETGGGFHPNWERAKLHFWAPHVCNCL